MSVSKALEELGNDLAAANLVEEAIEESVLGEDLVTVGEVFGVLPFEIGGHYLGARCVGEGKFVEVRHVSGCGGERCG